MAVEAFTLADSLFLSDRGHDALHALATIRESCYAVLYRGGRERRVPVHEAPAAQPSSMPSTSTPCSTQDPVTPIPFSLDIASASAASMGRPSTSQPTPVPYHAQSSTHQPPTLHDDAPISQITQLDRMAEIAEFPVLVPQAPVAAAIGRGRGQGRGRGRGGPRGRGRGRARGLPLDLPGGLQLLDEPDEPDVIHVAAEVEVHGEGDIQGQDEIQDQPDVLGQPEVLGPSEIQDQPDVQGQPEVLGQSDIQDQSSDVQGQLDDQGQPAPPPEPGVYQRASKRARRMVACGTGSHLYMQ